MRMEWLEKSLATRAAEAGVMILVKTRIIDRQGDVVTITGAGSSGHGKIQTTSIINQTRSSEMGDQEDESIWYGAIAVNRDLPDEWDHHGFKNGRYSIPRADGTTECWAEGGTPKPVPGPGWLEIMSGRLPRDHLRIGIDSRLQSGIKSAEMVIEGPTPQT